MTDPRAVLDGWQRIVGTPAQVRDAVAQAAATGRYDTIAPPRRVPGSRGQVEVYLRIRALEQQPGQPAARTVIRRWPAVAVGVAVLAAGGTVTVLAATWAVDNWRQLLGAGIVALVLLVAWQRARR